MDSILTFGLLVFLVVAAVWLWRWDGLRARRSRLEPFPTAPSTGAVDVRGKLLGYGRDHPGLDVHELHGGHLRFAWKLRPVHGDDEPRPESTCCVELRLADRQVEARYGQGAVKWCANETGESVPAAEWEWDMAPDFGHLLMPDERLLDADEHSPHTARDLVLPLQMLVRESGYAWQPTLEMPVEGPAEREPARR